MSFLAGRLAAKEAEYFIQESRNSVTRLLQKKLPTTTPSPSSADSQVSSSSVDVLPEVLRHSLPPKLFHQPPLSDYSSPTSASTKWSIQPSAQNSSSSAVSSDALNPLRGYVSLPQVTFGPKRWQMPEAGGSVTASTANELREDRYTTVNPEKLKAATQGLAHIGKAFAAATAIIFGGAALTFGLAASKLEVRNVSKDYNNASILGRSNLEAMTSASDDIKIKGRDLVQPQVESFRERLVPLRTWVEEKSKNWHHKMEHDMKETPFVKELSKRIRAKASE
ncbi:hypothetical protein V2J09_015767 [Rumex salicifolius]